MQCSGNILLVLHLIALSYLQVVAAVQGKLLSIYDGVTQYQVGQTLHAKRGGAAWAPLDACYFAFPSMQQVGAIARNAYIQDICTTKWLVNKSTCYAEHHHAAIAILQNQPCARLRI